MSLAGGSRILTSLRRATRPVEELAAGDDVVALDEVTGRLRLARVIRVRRRQVAQVYVVVVGGETIAATYPQALWALPAGPDRLSLDRIIKHGVPRYGWHLPCALRAGDRLPIGVVEQVALVRGSVDVVDVATAAGSIVLANGIIARAALPRRSGPAFSIEADA